MVQGFGRMVQDFGRIVQNFLVESSGRIAFWSNRPVTFVIKCYLAKTFDTRIPYVVIFRFSLIFTRCFVLTFFYLINCSHNGKDQIPNK